MGINKRNFLVEKILVALIIIIIIVAAIIFFVYLKDNRQNTNKIESNQEFVNTQNNSIGKKVNSSVENKNETKENDESINIEKLKNEQKLICKTAMLKSQHEEFKNLYPDVLLAEVKNNTDEIVKEYNIIFLAYDENYLPVKIREYAGDKDEYFFVGRDDTANLVPGDSTGMDRGWEIDYPHNVKYVIACVRDAIFYNGEEWKNPYITHWLDKYEGNILPEEDREGLIAYN